MPADSNPAGPVLVCLTDDLTGATATAALLSATGLPAVHVIAEHRIGSPLPPGHGYVINTGTRDMDQAQATRQLHHVLQFIRQKLADRRILWSKRIDSTLRGHIAAELAVLASAWPGFTGMLMAPAFPQAERTTKHGIQHQAGQPVGKVAGPTRGCLASLVEAAGLHLPYVLSVDDLRAGGAERVAQDTNTGNVLIADAVSDRDLQILAEQTLTAWLNGALIVDSGPYTAYLAAAALQRHVWTPVQPVKAPVIVIIGSRSQVMPEQVHQLADTRRCMTLHPPFDEIMTVTEAQTLPQAAAIILVADQDAADIDAALHTVAAAGQRLLATLPEPTDLLLSGGRTAARVLQQLQIPSIEMLGELAPLTPVGIVRGGKCDGALLATKGGLVGGPDALTRAVDMLQLLRRTLP